MTATAGAEGGPVDDLTGTASERLARLEQHAGPLEADWLLRQLMAALRELADAQPAADAEHEAREDY